MSSKLPPAPMLSFAIAWSKIFCTRSTVVPNCSRALWIFSPKLTSHFLICSKAGLISSMNLSTNSAILAIAFTETCSRLATIFALASLMLTEFGLALYATKAASVVEPAIERTTSVPFCILVMTAMPSVKYVATVVMAGSSSRCMESERLIPMLDQPLVDLPRLCNIFAALKLLTRTSKWQVSAAETRTTLHHGASRQVFPLTITTVRRAEPRRGDRRDPQRRGNSARGFSH
mmetsp:Transcript_49587/g.106151  ORF Transcript_49587/g.106151 Transcript_49587/m.106151 type:complete len:232 (-) Transcript_49587:46-741(-)